MALPCRRNVAACILVLCWSCQQCVGFIGCAPLRPARHGVSTTRKHETRQDRGRGPSSPATATRMVAAPAELWDSYLHALDAAPLLTKVGRKMAVISLGQRTHVIDSSSTGRMCTRGELLKVCENLPQHHHVFQTIEDFLRPCAVLRLMLFRLSQSVQWCICLFEVSGFLVPLRYTVLAGE